jgi:hypothetical protein
MINDAVVILANDLLNLVVVAESSFLVFHILLIVSVNSKINIHLHHSIVRCLTGKSLLKHFLAFLVLFMLPYR